MTRTWRRRHTRRLYPFRALCWIFGVGFVVFLALNFIPFAEWLQSLQF